MFASLTLQDHELDLFEEVYSVLQTKLPPPDLVIHLQAPVDVLTKRIASRGRSYEQEIQSEYLEQLSQLYHQEFSRPRDYQVIMLDTTGIDFRKPENIDRLLNLMVSQEDGRIEHERFMDAPTTSLMLQI